MTESLHVAPSCVGIWLAAVCLITILSAVSQIGLRETDKLFKSGISPAREAGHIYLSFVAIILIIFYCHKMISWSKFFTMSISLLSLNHES